MKTAMIVSSVALAAAVLVTVITSAKDRATQIYFTNNYNKGTGTGQFPADCIGIVATDPLPARKSDKVSWKVVKGHGGSNHDDDCATLDPQKVELVFQTTIVGASRRLQANAGGNIDGVVDASAAATTHKYQVFYDGKAAGPDPVIIVDCPSCGDPVQNRAPAAQERK
jgi:hypothetical protein